MSDEIDRDAIEILGIDPKIWKEFRGMIDEKYVQDDLPNFLKAEAEARESGITKIQTQDHLAKWGIKFEKYASFSKDPAFKKRMWAKRKMCFDMMNGHER